MPFLPASSHYCLWPLGMVTWWAINHVSVTLHNKRSSKGKCIIVYSSIFMSNCAHSMET